MGVRVAIIHHTRYRFDRPVRLSPHEIRLRPAPHCRTFTSSYALTVRPVQHLMHWQFDAGGNHVARLVFQEPASELAASVNLVAELAPLNPFAFLLDPSAERLPLTYPPEVAEDLAPYLKVMEHGPRLIAWLAGFRAREPDGATALDFLVGLNQALAGSVRYLERAYPGVQTCETTLEAGSGSCRDSAWLLVQLLRHCAVAARFVSGYLVQLGTVTHGSDRRPASREDRVDLHAWAEAYLPGAGWIGFDATSGVLAAEGHIPLACAATPSGAAPVTGTVEPCAVRFEIEMMLNRLHDHT